MNKTTKPTKTLAEHIKAFRAEFQTGVEAIARAAKIYATAVLEYPDKAVKEFHATYPAVSAATWEKLRLIGNGDVHPAVMLCSDRIGLRIARLPIKEQNKLLDGKTALKVVKPSTGEVEEVPLSKLAPRHEAVLFGPNNVRSITEQREFVKERIKEADKHKILPYVIEGQMLVVNRACRLGLQELEAIIAQIRGGNHHGNN